MKNPPLGTVHAIVGCVKQDFPSLPNNLSNAPLILVVDDAADERNAYCEILSDSGFQCLATASVAEAIEALQANKKIALIVLDWVLDRSGSKVVQVARELYPQIPILVISGNVTDPRPDVFNEAADAFLGKPFQNITLTNQVRQLLKRSQFIPPGLYPQRIEEILRLDDLKSRYLQHVLRLLDNNLSAAAKRLGVHRQTLSSTLKKAKQEELKDDATLTGLAIDEIETSLRH